MYWAYESAVNCSDRIIVLVEPLVTKLISDYFYVCEYLGSAILPYVFCSCVIMDNLFTSSQYLAIAITEFCIMTFLMCFLMAYSIIYNIKKLAVYLYYKMATIAILVYKFVIISCIALILSIFAVFFTIYRFATVINELLPHLPSSSSTKLLRRDAVKN